jgi:hypothetical protein
MTGVIDGSVTSTVLPYKEFRLTPPFQSAGGFSWLASLPNGTANLSAKRSKVFQLHEDGVRLGLGNNSMHADIKSKGGGLNSFWTEAFCFSSSDNSDPNANGRSYSLVQLVNEPIGIWPFAGCTVYNPVYALESMGIGWNSVRKATNSNSIYSHTPGEHLQFLAYLEGDFEIPHELHSFCNINFERASSDLAASIEDTDVALIEICSDVEIVFRGTLLNRLRLVDAILEPAKIAGLANSELKPWFAATQKWYYDGLLKLSPNRQEFANAIQPYLPKGNEQERLIKDIVSEAYPRRVTVDAMMTEVRRIGSFLQKPVGVVTHTQRYMPDGRPLSWPPDLHHRIIDACRKEGVKVLHPCELVAGYGSSIALKEDLTHWHDDFLPVVGRAVFDFAQSVLADTKTRLGEA